MKQRKRILAIASVGGHWIELIRLMPLFQEYDTTFVSTHKDCQSVIGVTKFYEVTDFNRWNKIKMLPTILKMVRIFFKVKPEIVISTGAAPGLIGLIIGKLFLKKTIWIDSIANVEELSMSGKIASKFVDKTYVQWPNLANEKLLYVGNIL